MNTLETAKIPAEQLDELDAFAASASPEMRDVLMSLTRCTHTDSGG